MHSKMFTMLSVALLVFIGFDNTLSANWKAEWEQTLAAAKREGKLALHMGPTVNAEVVAFAFQERFPEIKVTTGIRRTGHFVARLMTERRAKKYVWDVCMCGPTGPFRILYPAKALASVKSELILPEVKDESKWWSGRHLYVDPDKEFILAYIGTASGGSVFYNTNLINPDEINSYRDLLKAKWKGKILALDPRTPGPQRAGGRTFYYSPDLGPEYIEKLFGEMDVTISRDRRQATDWLVVGRFPICLWCNDARIARGQGLPVEEFETVRWKETPSLSLGGTGSIIRINQTPHPNAAKVFINWILSREGQTVYQKVVNSRDSVVESLRVDISKDPIPEWQRRKEGVNYIVMSTPERSNQRPVNKFFNKVLMKRK
ncbi:MAG: hypothetical protein GTO40_03605 [Deltaproteobacteria bacterium]|nr:hypothetical protein [Deltaproteobacteria bacterium]